MTMHPLLSDALDAHGGLAEWRSHKFLSATIVTGGEFWGIKGIEQDADPRRTTADLHRQWGSLERYGNPDWTSYFTPDRIAIEDGSGAIIAERSNPRVAFAGHEPKTPWDPLHRAYFSGYALWTYFNVPFLLADLDFSIDDVPAIEDGDEIWRGLRASFPDRIATHSTVQDFYFGPDGLLRRHDYHVDVAGGFAAAHLVADYVDVERMKLPTRRRAYQRNDDLSVRFDPLMVSIDVAEFTFS
ncbi:hypothetical protein [Roseibium sp. M-1]